MSNHLLRLIFFGIGFGAIILMLRRDTPQKAKSNFDDLPREAPLSGCFVPPLKDTEQFFAYLENGTRTPCSNLTWVGGAINKGGYFDGDKAVCFDPKYAFAYGKCNVMSFGINNEWSFDLYMDQLLGCKVFAFDPTMGRKDFWKTKRIKFHNLGISSSDGLTSIANIRSKVERYEGIIYRLGLQDSNIDYLKMDAEGAEIDFLEDVLTTSYYLLKKIKQLGIEIHTPFFYDPNKMTYLPDEERIQKYWKIFHEMACIGFEVASVQINRVPSNHVLLNGKTRSHCYEILWLRV